MYVFRHFYARKTGRQCSNKREGGTPFRCMYFATFTPRKEKVIVYRQFYAKGLSTRPRPDICIFFSRKKAQLVEFICQQMRIVGSSYIVA